MQVSSLAYFLGHLKANLNEPFYLKIHEDKPII